ncbi:MAG: polymorphic toxin type 50 domain-containing protein [Clostridiales bacterium]|nr:polymorphic toxin type 50 domain-containing protein [Clostridiales bacterium]
MSDKNTLDYYVSELRRIEKSRQADSEKEIRKIFKNLLKDLNSFLAEEYANFSNGDGILSVAVLQEKARYAKFLQEVDEHLKSITVEESKAIQKTVEDTYKAVYEGMVDAVTNSADNEDLMNRLEGLSVRPEVMNRAVNNPISGLTLPDTLEKHRAEIIYGIKQRINIGLMTGERYDTMAKGVKKVISGDNGSSGYYEKAMNIVRTESHRVQESGFYDCAKEIAKCLEGSDLIYTATWHNMGDQRVRPNVRKHTSKGWKTYRSKTTANHIKMEGKIVKIGDKFELEPGVFAECPGSSGTARNDCNCRCFLEYSLMNVEEFAKATGKTVEEVKKEIGFVENEVENSSKSDIIELTEKQKILQSKIDDGSVTTTLNPVMQRKHMEATREQGRSYFTVSIDKLQEIVNKTHGTGTIHISNSGQVKETIKYNENIAVNVSMDSEESSTNRFTIHYSKTRTHVVPTRSDDDA